MRRLITLVAAAALAVVLIPAAALANGNGAGGVTGPAFYVDGELYRTGGIDELEGHFDPVTVRLVEYQLGVPLERLALGIKCARIGRVRDLLYTDDNLHS